MRRMGRSEKQELVVLYFTVGASLGFIAGFVSLLITL